MSETVSQIDAHQHFWPREVVGDQTWRPKADGPLRRQFLPSDLAPELETAAVSHTVLMQSVDRREENTRLVHYAANASFVAGVVGWAPLTNPPAADQEITALLALAKAQSTRLVGVRCLLGHDDPQWAYTRQATANFDALAAQGLVWDVVPVTTEQVAAVLHVADQVPDLRIVVDHLARPPMNKAAGGWARSIGDLAVRPNVAIKLSIGVDVLAVMDRWQPGALQPYVLRAIAEFGPERAMLASNWPVCLLRTSYANAWSDMRAIVAEVTGEGEDFRMILGGTANEWYGLLGHTSPGEERRFLRAASPETDSELGSS